MLIILMRTVCEIDEKVFCAIFTSTDVRCHILKEDLWISCILSKHILYHDCVGGLSGHRQNVMVQSEMVK